MTTKTKSGRSARWNSWITLLSILGILVLLNVLGSWVFGKLDVTENDRYTLSQVSRDAIKALDAVDVQVFISKDLPPTITSGYGRQRDIRGVGRELLDKLAEYQSYSGGAMTVTSVRDDIELKAGQARLELFTGKSAQVEGGRLEFAKYALGATFQYRDQLEVFPLALEPESFEFEITRILLRLHEKYEKSRGMKDQLEAGNAMAEAIFACHDKLESYRNPDADAPLGVLAGGGDMLTALRMDRVAFFQACEPIQGALRNASVKEGQNENLDQLIATAQGYQKMLEELSRQLEDPSGGQGPLVMEHLFQLKHVVDKDHELLKNAPGRKAIGFLCGHREFCPFPDMRALIRPELAAMLGQQNAIAGQFLTQTMQIEQQINQINAQLRQGLFVQRGLNIKRIDPGQDFPDDIAVLVVYGPQKSLLERDLYNIDQFLLSGRSVIVFAANHDVSVYNIRSEGTGFSMTDLNFEKLERKTYQTNLAQMLANYGVKLNSDLVVEPKSFEPISIMQMQRQGQFTLQSQREFPYPLLPTFSDLDRGHVLVRRLESITMPYTSTIAPMEKEGIEHTPLVRTSKDATATTTELRLSPPELMQQLPHLPKNGPHVVAMVTRGEFTSAFAGKEIPPRPPLDPEEENMPRPKPVDRPFIEKGQGRLLVIGSSLGLENLSVEKVFDGFQLTDITNATADYLMKLKGYIAAFQNWQLRLGQIGTIVQSNLEFIYNCLDWGIQNEALVDIRSKGLVRRPIISVEPTGQNIISLSMIVGIPLLFVLAGGVRFAARRRKKS